MTDIVQCPSGLTGRIRKMKASEARKVWQRGKSASADPFGDLIAACWVETQELGPYELNGHGQLDWTKVILGERLCVLNALRVHTLGPLYEFSVNCERQACGERIEWEVDLSDLSVKELTDENLESFANGNRFETTLPGAGCKVWFKMLLGQDEAKLARRTRSTSNLDVIDIIKYRTLEVEGIEKHKLSRFLDDLDWDDVVHLWNTFQEVDCGLDTRFDIRCPQCNAVQRVDLPFDQAYLLPQNLPTRP